MGCRVIQQTYACLAGGQDTSVPARPAGAKHYAWESAGAHQRRITTVLGNELSAASTIGIDAGSVGEWIIITPMTLG